MPLIHSSSKPAISENIRREMGAGKPQPQAVAIALDIARRAKRERAEGGKVFEGPIVSAVPGRTDRHPIEVASGSYVLPSETISHLGENNTLAGLERLKKLGAQGLKRMVRSCGGAADILRKHKAKGGSVGTNGAGHAIPVIVAGGEHVLSPQEVAIIGEGDVELGHRLLDNWVMKNRRDHISTLSKLKPPAKD